MNLVSSDLSTDQYLLGRSQVAAVVREDLLKDLAQAQIGFKTGDIIQPHCNKALFCKITGFSELGSLYLRRLNLDTLVYDTLVGTDQSLYTLFYRPNPNYEVRFNCCPTCNFATTLCKRCERRRALLHFTNGIQFIPEATLKWLDGAQKHHEDALPQSDPAVEYEKKKAAALAAAKFKAGDLVKIVNSHDPRVWTVESLRFNEKEVLYNVSTLGTLEMWCLAENRMCRATADQIHPGQVDYFTNEADAFANRLRSTLEQIERHSKADAAQLRAEIRKRFEG